MGAPELLALSLGLSVATAALAWASGRLVERLSADPRLRDRVWAAALILPALPPLAVGLLLLTPAPVRNLPAASSALPTALVTAPAEFAAIAPAPSFVFDPAMAAWAVLGLAALLTAARLTALAIRARRLVRIVRQAEAPGAAVTAMVETAALELAIRTPRVRVSAATSEALLAHLGRVHLILPRGLTDGADTVAASAVVGHELAHLKRGDHHALWQEEALLALLAVNPLMPMLRARRAAAREEACDALALGDAVAETRRAYARSLIEALRDRAGPQASGGLPALTFTGAGRTTAMHRLKAVLSPAPAAGRGPRLMALGLAGLMVALAGAGSLAVAGEREAVVRPPHAIATPPILPVEQPRSIALGAGARTLLNGEPLPEGLPMWAVAAERIDVRTAPAGSGEVNLILPFTGSSPVSVNGRRMPAGFPAGGVNPDAVARVEVIGDHVRYTLKTESEVRRVRRDAATPAPKENHLTPGQQADYRNPDGRQYQTLCASRDPGDDGFCAGVMFSVLQDATRFGVCPPAALDRADEVARRVALMALVERGKAEIARGPVRSDDTAFDVARSALARAYPCGAAAGQVVGSIVPANVMARPIDREEAAALGAAGGVTGDSVLLTLDIDLAPGLQTTPDGTLMVRIRPTDGRASTRLQFAVGGSFDPIPMAVAVKGSAATPEDYVITAEIRDADSRVIMTTTTPVRVTAANRPVRAAVTLAPAA
ncbi:M56 family metallopeptidase [Brevundimonas sp.]|uniref:M56 family metallopeptidase n=1 Tax=Brevundimonas sp. TaxID=1871086 RepID=UPI00356B5D78